MNWDERRYELESLASEYSTAMGEELELTEFRKILKAELMKKAEVNGVTAIAAQEREAYSQPEYKTNIEGLRVATEKRCLAQWKLKIAEMGCSIYQTQEATKRAQMGMR